MFEISKGRSQDAQFVTFPKQEGHGPMASNTTAAGNDSHWPGLIGLADWVNYETDYKLTGLVAGSDERVKLYQSKNGRRYHAH